LKFDALSDKDSVLYLYVMAKTILDMVTGDTPTSDEGKNPAAVAYRIKRSQFSSQLAELDLLKL
jgi:hypothetical protein